MCLNDLAPGNKDRHLALSVRCFGIMGERKADESNTCILYIILIETE